MRAHPAGPRHAELLSDHAAGAPPADLCALDPKVWSTGVSRGDDGALRVAGLDVRQVAAEHGTPAFVLDEADFRGRARAFADAFAGADVYYAAKAFLSIEVARWVASEGLRLDVCSGGELAIALRAGFPPELLALHGNNKSGDELEQAVASGVGHVVLDAFDEIDRLSALASAAGRTVRVLVRATVGVEAHTHEFIATAHEDQKFGFSLASGEAASAVRRVLAAERLELVGLHSHIGSQIFDTAGFEVAAHRLVGLHAQVRDEHGVELPEMGLGGGFGIAYTSSDDPMPPVDVAKALREIVAAECAARGLAVPRLSIEPGRAVVGPSALTLYEVGTVKPLIGLRTYVSIDGGMSDNIRTALYDAEYTVVLANRTSIAPAMLSRVVGKHCESGDVVVRDAWLPADIARGDLLAIAATGAYCRSMASTYNAVGRPPVIAVREAAARVLLRRETIEDLLALDRG